MASPMSGVLPDTPLPPAPPRAALKRTGSAPAGPELRNAAAHPSRRFEEGAEVELWHTQEKKWQRCSEALGQCWKPTPWASFAVSRQPPKKRPAAGPQTAAALAATPPASRHAPGGAANSVAALLTSTATKSKLKRHLAQMGSQIH